MENIEIDGESLSIAQVIAIACQRKLVYISESTLERVRASRAFLETQVHSGKLIYGINTGFGSNATELIDNEATAELQRRLLLSHACGVGENFSTEIVRAIMLIRLNTLLAGYSGIQEKTILLLLELLNRQIHPIIPSQGSVGASGDLCPLSHMALPLIGEGKVEFQNQIITAHKALEINNLKPVVLAHKEGIALSNGTSVMTALGVLGVYESKKLLNLAVLASSLAFEGLCARKQAFDAKVHTVRRHQGQQTIAQMIREFSKGSEFIGLEASQILQNLPNQLVSLFPLELQNELEAFQKGKLNKFSAEVYKYLPNEGSVPRWQQWSAIFKLAEKKITPQDSYSVRCTPQVLGASLQAILHAETIVEQELNAVVDNPLLFKEENEVLSGGNFHGQPIALVLDYLKLGIAEMGNLLERQINKLVDPATNDFLPAFLVENPGLDSGWMIPQYVAASLVSENKVLVHPASADSIPTSANQEDHVSMGTIGGRQALEMLNNVKKIVAILILTAAQAFDLRKMQLQKAELNPTMGAQTTRLYEKLRQKISYLAQDRLLYEDIQVVLENFDEFLALV